MWHPKKNLDPFLPVFTHFFMSSSGPRSKISKKGNSMICLNMVQQPPRVDVASGPVKHLGPGVQLRLWLWIAVNERSMLEFSPFWSQFALKLVESAVIQFGDNFYRLLSSSGKCFNSRTYLFWDWIKPWSWYEMWINIRMEHRKLFSCYQRSLLSADIGHVLTFN